MEIRRDIAGPDANGIPVKTVETALNEGAAPGAALAFAVAGETRKTVEFGFWDNVKLKAVAANTVYDLASVTKLYTTALILDLHQSGKLSVFDPASHFLENYRDSNISILDLLTHRADFDIQLSEYREKYKKAGELNRALLHVTPPATPTPYSLYGNLGFIHLGKIVEIAGGANLNAAFRNLFDRQGLDNTYTGVEIKEKDIATPPTEILPDGKTVEGITHDETARILGGVAGHAGVFATADDLAKFGGLWMEGKIIKTPELMDIVFRNYDQTIANSQAAGWWMSGTVFYHGGFTGAALAINIHNGKVASLAANRTYYGRDNIKHRDIWRTLNNWVKNN